MKAKPPIDTIPMFDVPEPERRPAPRRAAAPVAPKYTRYRPKTPVKCDHCMAVLAENNGQGPHSLQARWARGTGDDRLLLCGPHAQTQRALDKLPPLEGVAK